ncbi:MAG: SpoIIE family protein phosphatase [Ruminiclostridium sp.]|nr:SpoIIE family protein phosphatase [Ruminiclostridium sp.]
MLSQYLSSDKSKFQFIMDILNGMHDWVRVIDRSNSVIFVNRSMEEGLGIEELSGKKCYEVLNRTSPCVNCITRKAVFEGKALKKEEIFNNRIYSVMSSPITSDSGEVHYVVEVFRDITKEKELENKILNQNIQLQQDLETARKLQMQLLPRDIHFPCLDYALLYNPCAELSGDMVNVFKIDEEHIGIYIADVSGHGVPASMLTIFLISILNKKTRSPSRALYRLFKQFNSSDFDKDSYITVFYGIYNTSTCVLSYSNAGHNCVPIICGKDGVQKLFMPSVPVSNWLDKPKYYDAAVYLQPGDRFFLYTDGVTDQWLGDPEKLVNDEVILNILMDDSINLNTVLSKISDYIYSRLSDMKTQPKDDITMAVIQPHPQRS